MSKRWSENGARLHAPSRSLRLSFGSEGLPKPSRAASNGKIQSWETKRRRTTSPQTPRRDETPTWLMRPTAKSGWCG